MPFGVVGWVSQRYHVLIGGPHLQLRADFSGGDGSAQCNVYRERMTSAIVKSAEPIELPF